MELATIKFAYGITLLSGFTVKVITPFRGASNNALILDVQGFKEEFDIASADE